MEPLHIGKSETFGRGDRNLSANIINLRASKDKFARWGDNYAYHIGDLSAAVLTSHPVEKRNPKYSACATKLFESAPTDQPKLAFDIYFWARRGRALMLECGPNFLLLVLPFWNIS